MATSKLRKLFRRTKSASSPATYYVHGSGLVPVPSERLNEIPKVISEQHSIEAERALQQAKAKIRVSY